MTVGFPPGGGNYALDHGRGFFPGHLLLKAISGGKVQLTGGASGTVNSITIGGVNLMSAAVTFSSSLAQTARLVVANINANAANHNYWATFDGTDAIEIWARDHTADTSAITVSVTTITQSTTNMNTYQARAAAIRCPSGGYGADNVPGTSMYLVQPDMRNLPEQFRNAVGFELLWEADEITNWYCGYEGHYSQTANTEKAYDIFQGGSELDSASDEATARLMPTFMRAAAACLAKYRMRWY